MSVRSIVQSSLIWKFFLRPAKIVRAYNFTFVQQDFVAGLTVAVVLLPQAMAYALIADLPPQMGLYGAIVGSIVGALWGSSSHLQTGPTNAGSLVALSVLIFVAEPNTEAYFLAAGLLAVLVGVFRLSLGVARLGILVNFVSDSVIVGFTSGAGLLIFVNQLKNLLRLDIPSQPGLLDTIRSLLVHFTEAHWPSFVLGSLVVLVIIILRWISPKVPGPLIAIIISSAVVAILGIEQLNIKVLGELPRGIPPFVKLPIFDLTLLRDLSAGAVAIAAIGLVEAMSIARSIANQTHERLESNQEFFGQGLACIASGFFSGYNCSGSFTRSAINHQAGGQTAISNVFCGLIVLVAILIFGGVAAFIPLPALAGVVLVVAIRLIKVDEMRRIWFGALGDRVIMIVTFIATLALPLQYAILIGIVTSLAYYLLQTSAPRVRTVVPDKDFVYLTHQPDQPACPQLGIIEILGDMYFGAVNHIEECILENQALNPSQRYLLLRISHVEHCDLSGIRALENIIHLYRESGGDVFFSRYRAPVLDVMRNTGFVVKLGDEHFLGRDQDAISILFHKILDPAICIYECPHRVFLECQNLPKRLDLVGDYPHTQIPDSDVHYIKPEELWSALHREQAPILVDVREPRELRAGFISGSLSIPLPSLLAEPTQLPKDQPIVFVCRGGRRSVRAVAHMREQGYDRVMALSGGMLAWEAANLIEALGKGDDL